MATTTGIVEGELVLYPEKSSLERLRYFFGQLLTQRDLEVEQSYHLRLQRLTQREAFGTGTVAGLGVTPATGVSDLSVFVNPGLAFDPDGRELILEAMECIPVAEASVPGAGLTYEEGSYSALASTLSGLFGAPITEQDLYELEAALRECGLLASTSDLSALEAVLGNITVTTVTLEPPVLLRDYLFDQLVGVTFVGLRYREVGIDPAPAVLDASCCGGVSCFPTRTSQGVYIVSSNDPFPVIEDPYTAIRECIDSQFFDQMGTEASPTPVNIRAALCACLTSPPAWRGLPATDDLCGPLALPIVPLAKVCWRRFTDGTEPSILNVDNCSWRPLAPGVPAIRAALESFTFGARPSGLAPRVFAITPADNAVLSSAEVASGLNIEATMDAVMAAVGVVDDLWDLTHYSPTDATTYTSATPMGGGPGGTTLSATLVGDGRVFQLAVSGGTLPDGIYLWRFPISGTSIVADNNGISLDGEPNPPEAVPSGNGIAGGTFEARFVVTSGS